MLSSSTLAQMHSSLSKPDSQLSTSLFHYSGPVGPWDGRGKRADLEPYRSRQFGGNSALNHCLLFKREELFASAQEFNKTATRQRSILESFISHGAE